MTLRDHIYSNIALPVDKDLESKIQDDLWLDQECYSETRRGFPCFSETEVESFMLKALVSDQPLLFQLVTTTFSNSRGGRLRELRL